MTEPARLRDACRLRADKTRARPGPSRAGCWAEGLGWGWGGVASGREEADSMRINKQVLSGADPGHGVRGAEGLQTVCDRVTGKSHPHGGRIGGVNAE